jgi:diacylglycerol kinase (ATP)
LVGSGIAEPKEFKLRDPSLWATMGKTDGDDMANVAVVAHADKKLGGGLTELREVLAREGYNDPLWFEVKTSSKTPKCARRAMAQGAEVIFVWGGDGTVQRCIDALAGTDAVLAILPAGTANLLAKNLEIPIDLVEAVRVGLHGTRRSIDTGTFNGEHFAVMAGTGFDAFVIKDAGSKLKDRIGRLAYFYTGTKNLSARRATTEIEVDGKHFFKGKVSCVFVGNVGKGLGGIEVFQDAKPDSGILELAVVTAKNPVDWARTLGRVAQGKVEKSPFVELTHGKEFRFKFKRRFPYEIDGGARPGVKKMHIKVHPLSITICVPATLADNSPQS